MFRFMLSNQMQWMNFDQKIVFKMWFEIRVWNSLLDIRYFDRLAPLMRFSCIVLSRDQNREHFLSQNIVEKLICHNHMDILQCLFSIHLIPECSMYNFCNQKTVYLMHTLCLIYSGWSMQRWLVKQFSWKNGYKSTYRF